MAFHHSDMRNFFPQCERNTCSSHGHIYHAFCFFWFSCCVFFSTLRYVWKQCAYLFRWWRKLPAESRTNSRWRLKLGRARCMKTTCQQTILCRNNLNQHQRYRSGILVITSVPQGSRYRHNLQQSFDSKQWPALSRLAKKGAVIISVRHC